MRLSSRSLALATLLVSAVAVPALAQPAPLSDYGTCPNPVSQTDSETAHSAYLVGKHAFDEADYPNALRYFKDAYRLDCNKHELLNIIARAYELSGNRAEAVNALETYLKRAKPSDADAIQRRIANLKQQMAQEQTASTAPSATTTAEPTATTSAPPPPPPQERHHGVAPWIVVGAGGAAAVTGAVLLVVGLGKISDARDECPDVDPATGNHICAAGTAAATHADDLQSQGNTLSLVGGIIGGVGVVAIAGGLVWHFTEPTGPEQPSTALRVRPEVAPGYAGASIGARF